ncbi:TPA: hypothetical protein ACUUDJ_002225 [Pseudomonas aeruginosa]|uniref:hypothetical protein n=1 Tax=Pseudomonas aeruginosa TaxID=287 RepID=UPI002A6A63B9|nr:hypothetical protein [Pseudomonas aeruginosa]MDY1132377.1 hypothetical protein [Pseudomonas aeruginosa]
MSPLLESAIRASATRLSQYIKVHREHPEISFHDHVKQRRREKAVHASSFKLICLDTLAWKCVADYRQNKTTLTAAMKEFGASIDRTVQTGRFAFPIGVPTYLELDSMVDPATREALKKLVDELSRGLCITSFHDRIGSELQMLRTNMVGRAEGLEDFLCSPVEMMGIPAISLPEFVKAQVDEVTFNKSFFDALYELPFSIQLEVAGNAPGEKWDNSRGITDLNDGKAQHQSEVVNLNTGIFLELKGGIEAWFINEGVEPNHQEITLDALNAMNHWKQEPSSRALPTMRILSSLYGLMRFDPNRRYKNGDPNDFLIAASALPVAHALFTDRKFANLLSDKRIALDKFSDCTVVSGFEEMARYLEKQAS